MKKTTKKTERSSKMPCTGCGRHAKFVTPNVTAWFCSHCFTENGNYNRYKAGLPCFKPCENIRVKDVLLGADGRNYKVVGKGYTQGEDKIYPVVREGTKEVIHLGDYFFVRKV